MRDSQLSFIILNMWLVATLLNKNAWLMVGIWAAFAVIDLFIEYRRFKA